MKRIIFFKKYLIIVCFVLFTQSMIAQNLEKGRHTVGINYGYGHQGFIKKAVDYQYELHLLTLEYYYTLWEKNKWDLNVVVHPQYNITKYRPIDHLDNIENGYEFGISCGFQMNYNILEGRLRPYALIGAGPHYVSGTPERQSKGFIFSDNFALGTSIGVYENLRLDLRFGFRHISNANIKKPNGGVNNFILNVGVLYEL